jgi:hypothetical protein
MQRFSAWFWVCLTGLLLLSRLCHVNILWADEDYHLAAAIQMLHGKMLYRDLWYDKPPLSALVALLFGAWPGWPLRLFTSVYAVAACAVGFRFSSFLWGRREGYWAAGLLAFCLVFYLPAATIPLEPDTLMILPHLAAVYLAWEQKPLAAGLVAGLSFALNVKGLLIVLACLVFAPAAWPLLLAGFVAPNVLLLGWLVSQHAFSAYVESVWRWGLLYAASSGDSLEAGSLWRVGNWLGFHATLAIAAAWYFARAKESGIRWRMLAWVAISLAAAALGGRFLPRYFNQLLPPLAIVAARGMSLLLAETHVPLRRLAAALLAASALVAIIRFGPRYFLLAADNFAGRPHVWSDVVMDQESRQATARVRSLAKEGETIFIWGYRPNIVVYTRLPVASRMWESQPLTGVPADRHLRDSRSVDPDGARQNRAELLHSSPAIIVDGLSAYNPQLDIRNYDDLAAWFRQYCLADTVGLTTVYRRCETN